MHISKFILSAVSFLLLLFSLHLLCAKQGNRLLNRLLSFILLARFGQIIVFLLITSDELNVFPIIQNLFTPLYYAAPACFFLYIISFINDRTHLRKLDWLHFIPAFLAVIHIFPWSFSSSINWNAVAKQIIENKQIFITEKTGLFPPYFYYFGRPVLMLAYLLASWYAVLSSRVFRAKEKNNPGKFWILFCLRIATVFKLISIAPFIFKSLQQGAVSYSWFVIFNCLILFFVFAFVLHQPKFLYGYLFVATNWKRNTVELKELVQAEVVPKKANILSHQLVIYTAAMKEFMENEKPFLLHEFQIVHLAQKLNIPVHHCSFAINNVIGKNFRDWINEYRIRNFITAYALLADKITIEAIAYKSGFKSMATFYNAFKKETGLMPTVYFSNKEK